MRQLTSTKVLGRRWIAVLFMIATVLSPLVTASSSGADGTWNDAEPAGFVAGVQNAFHQDTYSAVSCSGSTCVAAGNFYDANADHHAMTDTSSDGGITWAVDQPAVFAGGVTSPESAFDSVSCSGLTCVAAGQFYPNQSSYEGMTETSSDGGVTWSAPQTVSFGAGVLNSSNPDSALNSVSCSDTTCVAAGYFIDTVSVYQALTETSTDGGATWSDAQPANVPLGLQNPAGPYSLFNAVSCSGSTCVAAGYFYDPNNIFEAMTETSSDGGLTWDLVVPIVFANGEVNPATPYGIDNSVSCSGSTCVAAGNFEDTNGDVQAMTETSSDGGLIWDVAQMATFTSGPTFYAAFNSVSCYGLTCVAAGQFYYDGADDAAMTVTSSDGGSTWAVAQPAIFSSGEQDAPTNAFFNAVSCSRSTCVAAGAFTDVNGFNQAVTATSSDDGATWSNARPASFSTGVQSASPQAYFNGVSCTELTCVAAGDFLYVNANYEAMTETELLSSPPAKITNLVTTQSGSTLSATWKAITGATSYTCTLLFGFSTPSTFTTNTRTPACSFTGLNANITYGVSVVANGPGGTSASVSAFDTPTTTTTIHKTPRPVERTIVCVSAKKVKRVRGIHPTCPAGYKKR